MQRRWIGPEKFAALPPGRLIRELHPLVDALLFHRGFQLPDDAEKFLRPKLATLTPPELLPGIAEAVERIHLALSRKEEIVLYGDYDVDGVVSLTLLARVLRAYGAKVECFLPLRTEEGYGLSEAGIERCFTLHSPKLLIAVDCGTNSASEIAGIGRRGADVIVLDHHEVSETLPDCVAMVNPKAGGGFEYLCSAGVVFKLAHALLKRSPLPNFDLRDYLDLVALATVADLVPLVGENRILVQKGLAQMAVSRWPGIKALIAVSGVSLPVRGGDVGYRLAPRINAAGRLGPAQEALRLLLTDDPDEARRLANSLDAQNRERQNVERAVTKEADEWVTENFDPARDASIVAGRRDWHNGVLGIVASRIMRRHHRPTLIVGFDENGAGKGSGRSIQGISLVAALQQCSEHLDKYGGHEMAAGVTVQEDRFAAFREAFERAARSLSDEEMLTPQLRFDGVVEFGELGNPLLEAQEMLEPFGMANPQPVWISRGVVPGGEPRVLKEKHLKFDFAHGRKKLQAIFFNGAENALPRPPWDIAYVLERNDFNGRSDLQIQIIAIRSAV